MIAMNHCDGQFIFFSWIAFKSSLSVYESQQWERKGLLIKFSSYFEGSLIFSWATFCHVKMDHCWAVSLKSMLWNWFPGRKTFQSYRLGVVCTKTELYSLKSKRCVVISWTSPRGPWPSPSRQSLKPPWVAARKKLQSKKILYCCDLTMAWQGL